MIRGVRVMGLVSDRGYGYDLDAQRKVAARDQQMPLWLDHNYEAKPLKIGESWGTRCNPAPTTGAPWPTFATCRSTPSRIRF